MILIQTKANRNTLTLSEDPVLYADSLKNLAFSSSVQKIPGPRSRLVFSPELFFVWIHRLWTIWHPWSVKSPCHPSISYLFLYI